jgi:hypothetical protein
MPTLTLFMIIIHLAVKGPAGDMVINVRAHASVYGSLKQCRQAVEALRAIEGRPGNRVHGRRA